MSDFKQGDIYKSNYSTSMILLISVADNKIKFKVMIPGDKTSISPVELTNREFKKIVKKMKKL